MTQAAIMTVPTAIKTSPPASPPDSVMVDASPRATRDGDAPPASSTNGRRQAPTLKVARGRTLNRHLLNDFSYALLSPGLGKKQVSDPEMRDEIRRSFDVKKAQEDIIQARVNGTELPHGRERSDRRPSTADGRRGLRISVNRGLGSPVFGPSTGIPWSHSVVTTTHGRLFVRQHDVRQLGNPYSIPAGLRTAPLSNFTFGRPEGRERPSPSPDQSMGTTPRQTPLPTPLTGEQSRMLPSIGDLQLPTPVRSSRAFSGASGLTSQSQARAELVDERAHHITGRSASLGRHNLPPPTPSAITSPRVSTADAAHSRSRAGANEMTYFDGRSGSTRIVGRSISAMPAIEVGADRASQGEHKGSAAGRDVWASPAQPHAAPSHQRRHSITAPPVLRIGTGAASATESGDDMDIDSAVSTPTRLRHVPRRHSQFGMHDRHDRHALEAGRASVRSPTNLQAVSAASTAGSPVLSAGVTRTERSSAATGTSGASGASAGTNDTNLDILSRVARLKQQREAYLRSCAESFDAFHGI